ncbi:MAG: DUF3857 domain-containing protein [Bacteroidia bacterium]|nr:DUF3857 domain-containing protein [Bacteroidia bacterium]
MLLLHVTAQTSDYNDEYIPFYKSYKWNESISFPPTDSLNEPAVILKNFLFLEYVFEGEELALFETTHRIILLKDEEGVQAFNTLEITLRNNEQLKDLHIRVINAPDKIYVLDTHKVRIVSGGSIYQFAHGGTIRKYALEGIQKGSIVEYYYTLKKSLVFFGSEYLQNQLPAYNIDFELRSAPHLFFQVKTYNHLPDTSLILNKNYISIKVHTPYLPGLKNEKYANYYNHLARIEYSLYKNITQPDREIFSWNLAARNFYPYYTSMEKSVQKKLKKELQNIIKTPNLPLESKVLAIENYIKKNIYLQAGNTPEFSNPLEIITNKYANEEGILRLFCLLFKLAAIDFELVYTTKRFHKYFDAQFDSWNYLYDALIYIPALDKYIEPTQTFIRLGPPSYDYINNAGLFISELPNKKENYLTAKIKKIEAPVMYKTYNNINAYVFWNQEIQKPQLEYQLSAGGYYARAFKEGYYNTPDEKKNEYAQFIVKNYFQDFDINSIEAQNLELNTSDFTQPITFKAQGTATQLIEKAGNNYILKVGLLLGEQVQLYNEKERQLPIELEYPHVLIRKLRIKIPNNYELENLESLSIHHFGIEKDDTVMKFFSHYKRVEQELIIFVEEYYKKVTYPISQYAEFQKVINAAADFNKVALILRQKNY